MRTGRSTLARGLGTLVAVTAGMLSCSDATDVELLEVDGVGTLVGALYLDLDASGTPSLDDEPVTDAEVALVSATTGREVQTAVTDTLGIFALVDVPIGSYELRVDSAVLSDSLAVVGPEGPVAVGLGDVSQVEVGVSYPEVALDDVQNATLGNRIFTSGIALNTRVNFDPTGQVHFSGDSTFLRALNVERAAVAAGDSVRLLGRVVSDNGRVILQDVTPFPLIPSASLVSPIDVTPAVSETANDGDLDAALVRVRAVEITDTSTATDGHFSFRAWSGTDSIEVVFRSFLGFDNTLIRPDTTVRINRATGLLTPFDDGGQLRWRLLPRNPTDVVLETRQADIAVTASIDTTQASLGDTVVVTVEVTNSGPLGATGLVLSDVVPAALTVVTSSATTGTWVGGSGWTLGDLEAAAADTLTLTLEVTDGAPANVAYSIQSDGPVREVDPVPANNGVVVVLAVS